MEVKAVEGIHVCAGWSSQGRWQRDRRMAAKRVASPHLCLFDGWRGRLEHCESLPVIRKR